MAEREEDTGARTLSHVWSALSDGESLAAVALWDGHVVERRLERGSIVTVGRAHECELRIDHKSVSRRHVRLHVGERIEVEDLRSSNGTRVGARGLKSGARVALEPGQLVAIGVATVFVRRAGGDLRAPRAREDERAAMPWPEEGAIGRVAALLRLLARGDISVLLLGETGVGKEVAARALHAASPRRSRPFVVVNCAALPGALLESELFGHERGAFTGAATTKIGLLEAASGGTLFLDEVGELPLPTQAKLLRVLESGELRRLGSVEPRRVDVRFVSATNRELGRAVEAGEFRRDLFFRLAGMPVVIPALRERRGEIAPLASAFLEESAARLGSAVPKLSAGALAALEAHTFPGNIRELKNVLDRAVLLSGGDTIEPEHLALVAERRGPEPTDLREAVREFERQRILDALERTGGNQTAAAQLLGIGRRTLIDKMNAYGIHKK